jgi:hypothetical protein
MEHRLLVLCLAALLLAVVSAGKCMEYQRGQCIRCDLHSTLLEGYCRTKVQGCLEYEGESCSKCMFGKILYDGSCPPPPHRTA